MVALSPCRMVPAGMVKPRSQASEQGTVTVTALAAGGDGVARDEQGRVVFVPRSAPGDVVEIDYVDRKASYARGRITRIVTPAPSRREPPCPAYTAGCGGCQWLHVDEATQRHAKRELVVNGLRRVLHGVVVDEVVAQSPALGWRRRARLHVVAGHVGFYAMASHRVVAFEQCPQLDAQLAPAVAAVRASAPVDGEIAIAVAHDGSVATHRVGEPNPPLIEIDAGVFVPVDGFAQASRAGNAALVAAVVDALAAQLTGAAGPARVLELFAGAGNFTRALVAAGHVVTASDVVAPARWPWASNFVTGAAHTVTAQYVVGDFDAVVLDPPRAGAKEVMAELLRLEPAAIIYVSCDVATLARDVEMLVSQNYRLVSATPHDLMPQTAHIETVVVLARTAVVTAPAE